MSYASTISLITISSALCRMLFILPTHSIWSIALTFSSTPSLLCICRMMTSSRACMQAEELMEAIAKSKYSVADVIKMVKGKKQNPEEG